jgi:hypothetical protein
MRKTRKGKHVTRPIEFQLRDANGKLNQFRRPRLSVDIDSEPFNRDCTVCMTIDAQWGQPTRYIELSEMEARQLAAALLVAADLPKEIQAA